MISGLLAAPGIAFGKALVIKKERPVVDHNPIAESALPQQVDLFFKARHHSLQQLSALQQKTQATLGAETAAIFEAHSLLVEDKVLEQKIIDYIHQYKVTAATAIQTIFEQQATELDQLTDTYLQARAADLRDIALRLLKNAQGVPIVDLTVLSHPVILVTDDLTPSETAQLDTNYVLGFITDLGSQTSHTAIMARSLELPAIVGTNIITQQVVTGDTLILDAINNAIYINPDAVTTEQLRTLHHTHQQQKAALAELKNLPAVTLDGHTVEVCANIGHLRDLQGVHQHGAEGIGLYRTEFLFMERDALPSEEEQFQTYKSVAEQMGHHAVVIRTVDIGGDKALPFIQLPLESNPFLGCRGIRLCFQYPHILECQLRAILRASAFGKIRILFPMIIAVEEVRSLKTILNQIKQALTTEGHLFDASIEIGVMIETPAAALLVPHLAQEVDFFSIGTNDLIQYTLAVDRGNELIATLYNPLSPAVFCLIKQVIEAAHQAGKWVGMCGELAGDERATCLLLGLGLDEFSMSASAIPGIKKIIRSSHFKQTQLLAQQALAQPTAQDIIQLVTRCALVENALSGCASPLSVATP